jgi:hypothetical protein
MMIESAEYAQMQTHLFEVLWSVSSTAPERTVVAAAKP